MAPLSCLYFGVCNLFCGVEGGRRVTVTASKEIKELDILAICLIDCLLPSNILDLFL
jgi:hypothetical protein